MKNWISSAPANLMVMGEHSVVFGQVALACTLDQRLSIQWQTRADTQVFIQSALANHQTDLATLAPHPKLTWVMACLKAYQPQLTQGLNIEITAEFESTWGLGSSAALLAAMLGGLDAICEQTPSFKERFSRGLQIIHQLQGRGSGTDLAASLSGGLVLFNPKTLDVQKISLGAEDLPCQLWYSGYKTPTAEVLQIVESKWSPQQSLQNKLYDLMGETTQQAYKALQEKQWNDFYLLVNTYQGLMDALGVNDATLSKMIYDLRALVPAAKISGSGLGDCVMSFGEINMPLPESLLSFQQIDCQISNQGLSVLEL
ncbi:mevalonate kinase family protein [Thiosulfativibrio zosterae]|uniref:Mevalonate kinase n=1 Tax=Thiosulfativibrio zosterae TaxID=2675053 RepID=A0A6F8PL62_9GAMM|nr:GHMP kinase [Thiosulfativibrio zosterae]BBP42787.1 mevalonate kinase [Thiosulfativibrio zosterae]